MWNRCYQFRLPGEASATNTSTVEDTDIVPMETMRAELLKKSSLLSTVATDVSVPSRFLYRASQ